MSTLCLLLAVLASSPVKAENEQFAVVQRIDLQDSQQKVSIRIDLSRSISWEAFFLENPYRLVLDFPPVEFSAEPPRLVLKSLIRDVRFGAFLAGRGRVVFSLSGPAELTRSRALTGLEGEATIELDLLLTDKQSFQESPMLREALFAKTSQQIFDVLAGGPQEYKKAQVSVILIDPGHGGKDPGAVSSDGIREKDVVLDFSRLLERALRDIASVEVRLTRRTDQFISLADRSRQAIELDADVMISIHADKFLTPEVSGMSVYTLAGQANYEAERQGALDRVQQEKRSLQSSLLPWFVDLMQVESQSYARQLAGILTKALSRAGELTRNGDRTGVFQVLSSPNVPSVLIELGYLSNARDVEKLKSLSWRQRIARVIARAIHLHLTMAEARSNRTAPAPNEGTQ